MTMTGAALSVVAVVLLGAADTRVIAQKPQPITGDTLAAIKPVSYTHLTLPTNREV